MPFYNVKDGLLHSKRPSFVIRLKISGFAVLSPIFIIDFYSL